MMEEEIKKRREVFKPNVGPLFRKVLDLQKKNILKETYDVCDSSDWEASEIIAKKVMDNDLV